MSRPPTREPVGPEQVSVWDFPRTPDVVQWGEHVQVVLGGTTVADTHEARVVLETSHPPTYYLPATSFLTGALRPADGSSYCEWKGRATYLDRVSGEGADAVVAEQAAWTYPTPTQPGGFYGGWVTSRVAGPFTGTPGTMGW